MSIDNGPSFDDIMAAFNDPNINSVEQIPAGLAKAKAGEKLLNEKQATQNTLIKKVTEVANIVTGQDQASYDASINDILAKMKADKKSK